VTADRVGGCPLGTSSKGPDRGVILFPLAAAVIAAACAVMIGRDAARRPKPDKIAWLIAFALFALAAGAEVVGALAGWSPLLARIYYLAGAVLVVGYLALGELYLLAPGPTRRFGPGVMLLLTALSAAVVFDAPIDGARLPTEGWRAIERGPALVALAAGINGLGTVILAGGVVWSAWRFWRLGVQRHRMIGCALIAVGTLVVAAGGTLTRFGQPAYLYIAMALGVAIIFAGYLETRRSDVFRAAAPAPGMTAGVEANGARLGGRSLGSGFVVQPSTRTGGDVADQPADPAIAFIEATFLDLPADACARRCVEWSVAPPPEAAFDRETARAVWGLRLRLSDAGRRRFDALPAPAQAQLAELYDDVLLPPRRRRRAPKQSRPPARLTRR
jgi:hypothetical protein